MLIVGGPATVNGPGGTAVCMAVEDQSMPDIDVENQHAFVCWADGRHAGSRDIYYQEYATSGPYDSFQQADGWPVTEAAGDQYHPLANRNTFVWEDERRDPTSLSTDVQDDRNIYAQKPGTECDNPINMHWREMFAKWTTGSDAVHHKVTVAPDGSTVVVWDEDRAVGQWTQTRKVYIQKFDKDGVPRWSNNGMLLSDPGSDATLPDVCDDAAGGAFVAWQETADGVGTSSVVLKRVSAGGTITGIASLTDGVGFHHPVLVNDIFKNNVDVISRHEHCYLACIRGTSPVISYFDGSGEIGSRMNGSATGCTEVKMSTDYRYGCWALFVGTNALHGYHYNQGLSQRYDLGSYSLIDNAVNTLCGYDLTTDPVQMHRFTNNYFNCDAMFVYSAFVGGKSQLLVGRLFHQSNAGLSTIIGSVVKSNILLSQEISTLPSIAPDSLPEYYQDIQNLGGALIAWDEADSDSMHQVLTNRVIWQWQGGTTYTAIAKYRTQTDAPDNAIMADSIIQRTYPDIARIGIRYPDPTTDITLRFGVIVFEDARELSCQSAVSARAVVADYTDWIPNRYSAPALGQIGVLVSPYLGSFSQSKPIVQQNLLNSFSVFWRDTRTGAGCVAGTRMTFDETQKVERWLKNRSEMTLSGQRAGFQLSQNYPNPVIAGENAVILYALDEDAYVTLRIYDSMGREQGSLVESWQSAGTHSAVLLDNWEPRSYSPGVYRYELRAGKRVLQRSMIVLR